MEGLGRGLLRGGLGGSDEYGADLSVSARSLGGIPASIPVTSPTGHF